MFKKLITIATLLSLTLIITVGQAQAAFKMKLTDTVNTVTVDVPAGVPGGIGFLGAVGNWDFNITTASSKPATGTALSPDMKLLSVNSKNQAADDELLIELTDTDFIAGSSPLIGLFGSINGTDVHSLQYRAYADDANGEFALTTLIGDTGEFFSTDTKTFQNSLGLSGSYSLTMQVFIKHDAVDLETSFDAALTRVPEPGTLALLGLGLGLVGVSVRRRRG